MTLDIDANCIYVPYIKYVLYWNLYSS